ncbi:MAG: EamA family transporter [Spirochaetaceae bacterium]|nr:EamA family transporter [Spirochaetaceae bacterium]
MRNLLFIAASVAGSAVSQIFLKYSTAYKPFATRWILFILLSILSSTVGFGANFILFKEEEMSKISPILTAAVMVVVVVASIFLFNEKMTMRKGVGVGFAVVAVVLLAR